MAKLYDPAEHGLVAARFHFDRIPLPVLLAANVDRGGEEDVRRSGHWQAGRDDPQAGGGRDREARRPLPQARRGPTPSARLLLDAPSGNLVVEATLTGKPELRTREDHRGVQAHAQRSVRSRTPGHGRRVQVPPAAVRAELRDAAVLGLEVAQKEAENSNDAGKAAVEELFKGLARTVKTGEFDRRLAVRGPDKNGWYTVLARSRSTIREAGEGVPGLRREEPGKAVGETRWDVAKVGTVNIHTWKLTPGRVPRPHQDLRRREVHDRIRVRAEGRVRRDRPGRDRHAQGRARRQAGRLAGSRRGPQPGPHGQADPEDQGPGGPEYRRRRDRSSARTTSSRRCCRDARGRQGTEGYVHHRPESPPPAALVRDRDSSAPAGEERSARPGGRSDLPAAQSNGD